MAPRTGNSERVARDQKILADVSNESTLRSLRVRAIFFARLVGYGRVSNRVRAVESSMRHRNAVRGNPERRGEGKVELKDKLASEQAGVGGSGRGAVGVAVGAAAAEADKGG